MSTKIERTVRVQLGADGKMRRINSAGKVGRVVRPRVNLARLDSPAAFEPDADTPLLTRRELRELKPVSASNIPDLAHLRRRLHLSQGAFALIFGIPLATLKDWEQGRRQPDAPARAYLQVIAQNPKAVRNALKSAAE
jgi:putative transcriptional regulator